jgi:hypothetical protein
MIDSNSVKKSEHGVTDLFTIDPNMSITIRIVTDSSKTGSILTTLSCKDSFGSLSHYVLKEEVGNFEILVENTLNESREIKLNYLVFYD